MRRHLDIAIRMTILTAILLGLLYPLAITGIAQVVFPGAADGSLVKVERPASSARSLIAQAFTRPKYFHPRPSAAGDGYDAMASGGLQPRTDQPDARRPGEGRRRARDRGEPRACAGRGAGRHGHDLRQRPRPGHHRRQRPRPGAARRGGARHVDGRGPALWSRQHTTGRTLGFLGEPRVNVLELNLALDARRRGGRRWPPTSRRTRSSRCARCASADASRSSSGTRPASARPTACSPRRTAASRAARTSSSGSWRRTAARETAELVEGLEQVPLKRLEYRGKTFEELDTAAVIARRPEWVLVDELAHTNVPGTAHDKRWQSVEEILARRHQRHHDRQRPALREPERHRLRDHRRARPRDGAGLRGRPRGRGRARRPHPRRAAQPPEARRHLRPGQDPRALAQLLQAGEPRRPARAGAAQDGRGGRRQPRADHRRGRGRSTRGRRRSGSSSASGPARSPPSSFAAVTASPSASRAGSGSSTCARPGQLRGSGRRQVESLFELARELGGETVELSADSLGDEILRFAREKRATFIVMGQSRRSRVDEIVRGSLIARIIREIDHVDVLVVADPSKALPVRLEE